MKNSDIRQFIQKHPDISGKKIWNYVSDYYAPEQCKGCKHVQLIGMYPCSCCSVYLLPRQPIWKYELEFSGFTDKEEAEIASIIPKVVEDGRPLLKIVGKDTKE